MSLNRDQINSIAHLARLSLTEAEVPVYQDSLSKIVDLVGQLDAAPTQGVEPMAHPLPGLAQRLRPDAVTEKDQHELFQRNAPQVEAALYLVPKVIE
jgi:aspartyl-tRNA(Asn)/glutamyl-tRNA(Gln) amidotransferase subunit C